MDQITDFLKRLSTENELQYEIYNTKTNNSNYLILEHETSSTFTDLNFTPLFIEKFNGLELLSIFITPTKLILIFKKSKENYYSKILSYYTSKCSLLLNQPIETILIEFESYLDINKYILSLQISIKKNLVLSKIQDPKIKETFLYFYNQITEIELNQILQKQTNTTLKDYTNSELYGTFITSTSEKISESISLVSTNLFFMEELYNDHLLYVVAPSGFYFKTDGEILSHFLKKIKFYVTKNGLFISDQNLKTEMDGNSVIETKKNKTKNGSADPKSLVYFFLKFPIHKFTKYHFKEEFSFTVCAKSFKETMQCIKRKDSITFYIKKPKGNESPSMIFFDIEDEHPKTRIEQREKEVKFLSMQYEPINSDELEVLFDIDNDVYYNPVSATTFEIQYNHYLYCGTRIGRIRGAGLQVSEPIRDKDLLIQLHNIPVEKQEQEAKREKEILKQGEEYIPYLYSKKFSTTVFSQLTKLNSLSKQVSFFLPKDDKKALRIFVENGILGTMDILIWPVNDGQ